MKDPMQIRLSGAGGQGVITAGVILAEAAMLDGRNVVQTQTYGPEARLGSSKCEVIISGRPIAYPEVTEPDVLVCLSLEAAKKYLPRVRSDAVVIVDSTSVTEQVNGPGQVMALPITQTAVDAGSKVVANTVAISALNAIVPVVSPEALAQAIAARVPERFREVNEAGRRAGIELAAAVLSADGSRCG